MRLRSPQIYMPSELYALYKDSFVSGEPFDAFTLNLSVYVKSTRLLDEYEFQQQCKRTKLNQYVMCTIYEDYKEAQRNHINAVLSNNVVLTIFSNLF